MTSPDFPLASSTDIDSASVRHAGAELLSLALMDTRNQSLHRLSQTEALWDSQQYPAVLAQSLKVNPPQWDMGYLAWYQERWIARNLHRHLGAHCDGSHAPLASVEPYADQLWANASGFETSRWSAPLPSFQALRAYLLETLELTLNLLEKAGQDDNSLHFYRQCLFHEDRAAEEWLCQAQLLGLPVSLPSAKVFAPRAPVQVLRVRWPMGSAVGGFVPDNERAVHEITVPEFEIDAQPITWAQYAEFVDDGGYDRQALWSSSGWAWLGTSTAPGEPEPDHRAPRYVEQIGQASGAVLQTRFGRTTRMAGSLPVMHVTWWEADAFARWAGRRLPDEIEWEIAAHVATRRGWRWGDVLEWTGNVYRLYPGHLGYPASARDDADEGLSGLAKTVRGASFATANRLRHPKQRNSALPERDDLFIGFRTCAV